MPRSEGISALICRACGEPVETCRLTEECFDEMDDRQDYDPQPPEDVELCTVTERRQEPAHLSPGVALGPWQTYTCTRAGHDHDKHYHPEIGWWEEETDEHPF